MRRVTANSPTTMQIAAKMLFWICTSTEAQNQPHLSGTKVLLAPDPCGSFGLSFVWFGWKNIISYDSTMDTLFSK